MTTAAAPPTPTARPWRLVSGHAPAWTATRAMASCARVRLGDPTRPDAGLGWGLASVRPGRAGGAHGSMGAESRGQAPGWMEGWTEGPPLIPAPLPPEANSCLIHHGNCHMHADCISTGPRQVRQLGEPHTGAGPPPPPGCGAPRTGLRRGAPPSSSLSPLIGICDRSPAAAAKVTVGMASGPVCSWTPAPRSGPQGTPSVKERGAGEGRPAFRSPSGVLRASEGRATFATRSGLIRRKRGSGAWTGKLVAPSPGWPRSPGGHCCLSPVSTAEQWRLQPLRRVQKHGGWSEDMHLRRSPHRGGWLHLPSPCQPGNDARGDPDPTLAVPPMGLSHGIGYCSGHLTPPGPDPVTVHETCSDPRADCPGFPFLISALAKPWAPGAGTSTKP